MAASLERSAVLSFKFLNSLLSNSFLTSEATESRMTSFTRLEITSSSSLWSLVKQFRAIIKCFVCFTRYNLRFCQPRSQGLFSSSLNGGRERRPCLIFVSPAVSLIHFIASIGRGNETDMLGFPDWRSTPIPPPPTTLNCAFRLICSFQIKILCCHH